MNAIIHRLTDVPQYVGIHKEVKEILIISMKQLK